MNDWLSNEERAVRRLALALYWGGVLMLLLALAGLVVQLGWL